MLLAGVVAVLALPSAVMAFSADFQPAMTGDAPGESDAAQAEPEPARLVGPIALRSLAKGKLYPFTPAESPSRPDRSVTVAVRVDAETAKTISVRGQKRAAEPPAYVRIAPTGFNLGVSRGYQNFATELVPPADSRKAELPDLSRYSLAPAPGGETRLTPRIVVDERKTPGRAPRTFAGDSDDLVDVGGSLRVTRNLDVTAGVRYTEDRDRLRPLTDGKQDSQAVYVGTQFRF